MIKFKSNRGIILENIKVHTVALKQKKIIYSTIEVVILFFYFFVNS